MKDFIKEILIADFRDDYQYIFSNSPLIQYLDSKMGAVYGDSKTRRSLANIYAIYSMTYFYEKDYYNKKNEYKKFEGHQYTKLFQFCRELYGGEKLQNHGFNNRVNGEFQNKTKAFNGLIQIVDSKYFLHIDFLYVDNIDISRTINKIILNYIRLLKEKDNVLLTDLEELKNCRSIKSKLEKLSLIIDEKSEARVFEIISYAILKNHYSNTTIYWGFDCVNLKKEQLILYKTGRTNANDGGIDFVMRPLGRFFQVTEVRSFDKYLLDIDKVMHFPITFVIKTIKDKFIIHKELLSYIEDKSGGMELIKDRYINAIEEIITINELTTWISVLSNIEIDNIIQDIELYYKLEMNLL
jgi:hypothetical protein